MCVYVCLYVWTQFRLQSVRRMISLMNTVGLAIEGRTGPPNTLSGVGKKEELIICSWEWESVIVTRLDTRHTAAA